MTMGDEFYGEGSERLRFRELGGQGARLLLLHTLRTQLEYTEPIAKELRSNFRVVALDLPGHGQSGQDPERTYDAPYFIDRVEAFIVGQGYHELTVVGESIGATLALCLAARLPERIVRAVASNPHDDGSIIGGVRGRVVSFVGRYTELVSKDEKPSVLGAVLGGGFHDTTHLPDEFVELLIETQKERTMFPTVMKSIFKNAESWHAVRSHYGQIPDSTAIELIYGEHDWSSNAARRANVESIPQISKATVLKDTGHFAFLDNTTGVAKAIRRFCGLDGRPS